MRNIFFAGLLKPTVGFGAYGSGFGQTGRAGPNTSGGMPTTYGPSYVFNADTPGTIYSIPIVVGTPSVIAAAGYVLPSQAGLPAAAATFIWPSSKGTAPWPGIGPDPRTVSGALYNNASGTWTAPPPPPPAPKLVAAPSSPSVYTAPTATAYPSISPTTEMSISMPLNGTACAMPDGVTAGTYTNGVCVATASSLSLILVLLLLGGGGIALFMIIKKKKAATQARRKRK